MPVRLDDKKSQIVNNKRRNQEELPSFYSAELRSQVTISRDFEAFLILSSDELKTSANTWIKKAVEIHQENKDRDDLVALAIGQEKLNAEAKILVLDERLGQFDDFRKNFTADAVFAEVGEVQEFIFDLQRVVEEIASNRERAHFDSVVSQVTGRADDRLTVTDPEIEQLQSWTGVISAYLTG